MVADKPVIGDIMPAFISFIDESVLLAHNIGFDASFLVKTNERLGISTPDLLCVDTIHLAKKYFKGMYSYSLENLSKAIGIDIENAHRAEDDAEACMKLFFECIKKIPNYSYLELKELLKQSGIRKKTLVQNYLMGR